MIGNYRKKHSGTMRGYFTLEYDGLHIVGCQHHEMDGKVWFNFPCRVKKEGLETQFVPIVKCGSKKYWELQDAFKSEMRARLKKSI